MSIDTVPKFDDLFLVVIEALKELGGSATNQELYEKVTELDNISDDVLDILHNNGPMTKIEYRLRWTQTYLKKAGLLLNTSRGVWALTDKGRETTNINAKNIKKHVRSLYEAKIDIEKQHNKNKNTSSEIGEEISDVALSDELNWNTELLDRLKIMDPSGFERLSQRILREAGFVKVQVTGKSHDGGIDGIGVLRMNIVSFQVMFQCKRYKSTVPSSAIRDFRGAMMGRADKGLVITTGNFSAEARREAIRDGAPTIDLIDGDDLCDLLKRLRLGVSVEMVEEVTVHPKFFDQFEPT